MREFVIKNKESISFVLLMIPVFFVHLIWKEYPGIRPIYGVKYMREHLGWVLLGLTVSIAALIIKLFVVKIAFLVSGRIMMWLPVFVAAYRDSTFVKQSVIAYNTIWGYVTFGVVIISIGVQIVIYCIPGK